MADRGATDTARSLALIVHGLRRSKWVRDIPAARDWLEHGPDAEAQLLRRLPGWQRRALPLLAVGPLRALSLGLLDRLVPGTTHHVLGRKLWFHSMASEFLARADGGHVLILGVGLDGLGLRLAERFPTTRIREVDRPDTIAIRREWLADVHRDLDRIHCVGGDLAGDLDSIERAVGPSTAAPTLVLAEGLFMYLARESVQRLLATIHQRLPGRPHLLFSYLSPRGLVDRGFPTSRIARRLRRRRRGEAFDWAIAPEDLPDFLQSCGFTLEETLGSTALARRFLGPRAARGVGEYGEYVASARGDETIS